MLLVERGVSINTITAYKKDLTQYQAYINKKNVKIITADIVIIRNYLQTLNKASFSPKTISRKLSSLNQFYKFLHEDKIRTDNPTINIDAPKFNKNLPKFLDEQEIVTLIDIAKQTDTKEFIRLTAMLELLYASGMRVSELVELKFSDLQIDRGNNNQLHPYLLITGKGNKERMVVINNKALQALTTYLAIRIKFTPQKNNIWLFPSAASHITRQRFGQLLKELAIKAGIDPDKVSPHIVRHSFASHLLENGADLRVIQELLGHADISTTQIYTHIQTKKLKNIVNNLHPLAKKKL
jgi:integrase/recombinase XerD